MDSSIGLETGAVSKPYRLPHLSSGKGKLQYKAQQTGAVSKPYRLPNLSSGKGKLPDKAQQRESSQSDRASPILISKKSDQTGQAAPSGKRYRTIVSFWDDESCFCFEVQVKGIPVARRDDNHCINVTKLLNIAGLTLRKSDEMLKSEKNRSVVKIGPLHLKGIWIPFDRALHLANRVGITETVYPLFVHNRTAILHIAADQGSHTVQFADQRSSNDESKGIVCLRRISISRPISPGHSTDRASYWPTPPEESTDHAATSDISSDAWFATPPGVIPTVARERTQTSDVPWQKPENMPWIFESAPLLHRSSHFITNSANQIEKGPATENSTSSTNRSENQGSVPRQRPPVAEEWKGYSKDTETKSSMEFRAPEALTVILEPGLEDERIAMSSDISQSDVSFPQVDKSKSSITQSEDSDNATTESSEEDANVAIAFAKHQLIVSLMQDVYAIFNTQWNGGPKEHAPSQSIQRSKKSHQSPTAGQASVEKGKRRTTDRDSPPPEDNGRKRRRSESRSPTLPSTGPKRLFACPFHKSNPRVYEANYASGSDFRACAGPGFSTISRIKQHLRRKHEAPNDCPRCWKRMSDVEGLTQHLLGEPRCEVRDQPHRDLRIAHIDREKMRLINSSYGVSWEDIYRILFPGAPVPSPFYETCDEAIEPSPQNSPQSQELHDLESYQRAGLPSVVETEIHNAINAEMAPIEATLRTQVEDIVRRCLARMAESFQSTNFAEIRFAAEDSTTRPPPDQLPLNEPHSIAPRFPTTTPESAAALEFFQEPPHLDAEVYAPALSVAQPGQGALHTDSGYGSSSCPCSCHLTQFPSAPSYDYSSCDECTIIHIESEDFLLS